jgi:hypothetical protein
MTPIAFAQRILLPDVPELHMKALCIEALTTASKFIAHFTQKVATISTVRLRLLWHFESGVGILLQRNGNTCTYRNCEFRNSTQAPVLLGFGRNPIHVLESDLAFAASNSPSE